VVVVVAARAVKEVLRKGRASVESIARKISANTTMVLVTLEIWRLIFILGIFLCKECYSNKSKTQSVVLIIIL
jgi:hypothetical protein